MKIEVIQLGELEVFFYSNRIQKQPHLPISSLRVASQIKNPSAKKDDIALVVAFDNNDEMIAYCGCLPTNIESNKNERFCFSSGWWKNEEKGNLAALKVFAKALQCWNMRMIFDDLPAKSSAIINKSRNFELLEIRGKKYFLQFDFANWIIKRRPQFAFALKFFSLVDRFLNVFVSSIKTTQLNNEITINEIKFFDEESENFISQQIRNNFLNRSVHELNWILKYPWLSNKQPKYKIENSKYYFSLLCNTFENRIYKVYLKQELIAVLFFTNRDGLYKLPYLYYNHKQRQSVAGAIKKILYQNKAKSFLTHQKNIIKILKMKCIYSKSHKKTFAFPKNLKQRFLQKNIIQDGDGDVVFT